jgi:hypothetical protein
MTSAEPSATSGITEALGFGLQVLNRAQAALFAKQAELIERSGTFVFHAQTFRKQQQAAIVGHGSELIAPHFVVDQYSGVIAESRVNAGQSHNIIGVPLQLVDEKRRSELITSRFDIGTD